MVDLSSQLHQSLSVSISMKQTSWQNNSQPLSNAEICKLQASRSSRDEHLNSIKLLCIDFNEHNGVVPIRSHRDFGLTCDTQSGPEVKDKPAGRFRFKIAGPTDLFLRDLMILIR